MTGCIRFVYCLKKRMKLIYNMAKEGDGVKKVLSGLLAVCFLLCGCAQGSVTQPLPCPSDILGGAAVLYQRNYHYDTQTVCDAYTFPEPENMTAFAAAYGILLQKAGYAMEETVESGRTVYLVTDAAGRRAWLAGGFRGSLLYLVEQGMKYDPLPTPEPTAVPTFTPSPRPTAKPAQKPAQSNTAPQTSSGQWMWRSVEKDCPSCFGGKCSLCNGSGIYRMYGQKVACPIYCTACDGVGSYITQEYVYVP